MTIWSVNGIKLQNPVAPRIDQPQRRLAREWIDSESRYQHHQGGPQGEHKRVRHHPFSPCRRALSNLLNQYLQRWLL